MFDKTINAEDMQNIDRLIACRVELGVRKFALGIIFPLRDTSVIEKEIIEIINKYKPNK